MALLIIGLVLFLGVHVVPMSASVREAVFARTGERSYKLAFSILSGVGLVLIIIGFAQFRGSGNDVQLWSPSCFVAACRFRADAAGLHSDRGGLRSVPHPRGIRRASDASRCNPLGAGASYRQRQSCRIASFRQLSRLGGRRPYFGRSACRPRTAWPERGKSQGRSRRCRCRMRALCADTGAGPSTYHRHSAYRVVVA